MIVAEKNLKLIDVRDSSQKVLLH